MNLQVTKEYIVREAYTRKVSKVVVSDITEKTIMLTQVDVERMPSSRMLIEDFNANYLVIEEL